MRYRYIKHNSKLASVAITFGAGNRLEYRSQYPKGIAHFLEHMVFKGTKSHTSKELSNKIASAGGHWNAWTSEDLVCFHASIPEENIETALECLSDVVSNAIFPADELKKERKVVIQEVRMYDDDMDSLVHDRMLQSIFCNSLSNPIIGTENSVSSIERNDVVQFYEDYYKRDNMLVTLGSRKNHHKLTHKYFGEVDDKLFITSPDYNIIYNKPSESYVHKSMQLQDHISICFCGQKVRTLVDKREAAKVFSVIFGGSEVSRLFSKVRNDMGLVYGIYANMYNYMDGTLFSIDTSTEPKNTQKVIGAINKEIDHIIGSISKNELQTAKNVIKNTVYSAQDLSLSSVIQEIYKEFYGYNIGERLLDKVNEVTIEDVDDIANAIFNDNRYMVIGTNREGS